MAVTRKSDARERILSAAYDLFLRRGVRGVGIDEIIEQAKVANATFYRHFKSKDDLVRAFLERREQLWTQGTIVAQAASRSRTARGQLLAVFDIFDEWFQRPDYEGDPFITVLLEMGPEHRLGRAALERLDTVRSTICRMAQRAGLEAPEEFARSWQLLMKGAIITARMGDRRAGARARQLGLLLLEHRERLGDEGSRAEDLLAQGALDR
jgi:AcrR family transcriptional regulator